jgi:hypothetical protein
MARVNVPSAPVTPFATLPYPSSPPKQTTVVRAPGSGAFVTASTTWTVTVAWPEAWTSQAKVRRKGSMGY